VTQPREVIPGRTYLVSRRCTQRQHLLRPDEAVEQIFLYCLAEAIQRFKLALHGYVAMSNHEHLVVRDNAGNYPAFLAHFHKMVAKALNAAWGRWENFWAAEQPNVVYLVEASDRFDKLIYVLSNPVNADLVEHVADWPGACSLGQHLSGRDRVIKRPEGFFRADGPMPEEVTLHLERLEGFEDLSDAEWASKIEDAVRGAEDAAKERRREKGVRVLGRKAVRSIDPTSSPQTPAPRRRLRPLIACRNMARRVQELLSVKGFRTAYRAALDRWRAGERTAPFPIGTYHMLTFGACIVSAG